MNLKKITLGTLMALPLLYSCSDDLDYTGIRVKEPDNSGTQVPVDPADYVAPDYADDYSAIASWSSHMQWGLANVHDPSIAYWDGWYYMYNTDASYGNEHLKASTGKHFPGKRSRDLVNWYYVPGPMNEAPAWVEEKLNAIRTSMDLPTIAKKDIQFGYWAPVVRKVNVGGQDRLRMYYCIIVDNYIKSGRPASTDFDGSWGERAFIGMCETTDPSSGVWEDKGFVVCSSSDRGRDGWSRPNANNWDGYFYFNAIDPTYIVTPEGKHYLIYGSWHSGFALLEINPETGMPLNEIGDPWADNAQDLQARYGKRIGTRLIGSRWQGSEGPEIIYKDGYYYLFMAYDGLDVPYNTRVVRSENIEGPYKDINNLNFTTGTGDTYPIVTHPYKFKEGDGWVGISHVGVFKEEGGDRWFLACQGRLPAGAGGNQYANAIMMGHVRQLVWCPADASTPDNLWPLALPERYGAVPNPAKITAADIIGKWEHINLNYSHGNQRTAATDYLEFKDNGTVVGPVAGKWTYDEDRKWLTIEAPDRTVVLCVERELDWEASPRVPTLVYAGTQKNLKATWWGKKVNVE